MSTPSKKRRKAREGMQRAKEIGRRDGFSEARRRVLDDMMKLVPEDRVENDPDGRRVVRLFIDRFPNPREHGPYFRVPMPEPIEPFFNRSPISQRVRIIDFRPIRHAIATDAPGSKSVLEWITWEPTEGSEEIEERTSVLLKNFGQLCYASTLIRHAVQFGFGNVSPSAISDITRAGVLLDESVGEIRRVLGKFAPEPVLSPREAYNQYFRFPMMNDRW